MELFSSDEEESESGEFRGDCSSSSRITGKLRRLESSKISFNRATASACLSSELTSLLRLSEILCLSFSMYFVHKNCISSLLKNSSLVRIEFSRKMEQYVVISRGRFDLIVGISFTASLRFWTATGIASTIRACHVSGLSMRV